MFVVDEKLTTRVFRLYSHKMHKKRLIDIKSKASNRINNSVPRTLKYQNIKRSGYVSQVKERISNIMRENQKNYRIMGDISAGRRGTSVHQILDSVRGIPQPKSLNLPSRKREAQRIIDDNEALAKRLNESNRGVSFQKFDDDWENVTKYMISISKKNIRKLPTLENYSRILPSIASTDIGSKKGYSSRSPLSTVNRRNQSVFSPNLTTPLPVSQLEVHGPEGEMQQSKKSENYLSRSLDKLENNGNTLDLRGNTQEGKEKEKKERDDKRMKGVEEIKENDVEASVNSIDNKNDLSEKKIQLVEKKSEKEILRKNIREIPKQELELEERAEKDIFEKSLEEDSKHEPPKSKIDIESLENSIENSHKKSIKESEFFESNDKVPADLDVSDLNPEIHKSSLLADESQGLSNELEKVDESPEGKQDYDEYSADDDENREKVDS